MAGKYDLNIDQGSAFRRRFTLTEDDGVTPIVLTGFTGKAELRLVEGAGDAVLTATNGEDGGLTIDGEAGTIDLEFTGVQTGTLGETPYVWELVVSSDGTAANAFSVLKGQVNVSGRVASL